MPSQVLSLTGGPVSIEGAVALAAGSLGVLPWRIPFEQQQLYEPALRPVAMCPAGVRLVFVSDTSTVALDFRSTVVNAVPPAAFDLLVDGRLHHRIVPPEDARSIEFSALPAGTHLLEMYLPSQYVQLELLALRIDASAVVEQRTDGRPRWIAYGSSITHCRHAAGPSETWPALVAARCGLNLTCLGYGGNCHMEPMVARLIRDLPASYISLKLGINMVGPLVGSYSDRTFRAGVIGLIKTIRDGHPTTPIAVVSPIHANDRETVPNSAGMSLALARQRIAEAIDVLRQYGDQQLHYVDGLDLFGSEFESYLEDGVHPNAEGYRILADRYCDLVMPQLGISPG
jgi:hypothetical protein